ncbi:MAG: hypothetical protein PHN31_03470 [Candidatus Gracilibacteria bacterium]|nr:hypothetical protein [Candidatus Gracilibacteria bacterium]
MSETLKPTDIQESQQTRELKEKRQETDIKKYQNSEEKIPQIQESEKKDKELEKKLPSITNKEFLSINKNNRLEYITKPEINASKLEKGTNLTFNFTFIDQNTAKEVYNKELYLKTTAGQVLPQEIKEVKYGDEVYYRNQLGGEFFTKDHKRLVIHDGTTIEIGEKRTKEEIDKISKENQNKITEYEKQNPNSNKTIIEEAINRGIDPKTASQLFEELAKETPENMLKQIIEDAFTEYDRIRGAYNYEPNSQELIITLLIQFSKNWKEDGKKLGIPEEKIKKAEENGDYNMRLKTNEIKNKDSLPNGDYLKGNELLNNIDFSNKLNEVCKNIGANKEDMIKMMMAESTLDPRIVNSTSQATGLIQFMPKTAIGLGTSVGKIRAMSGVEQLDYVEKYFKSNSKGIALDSLEKLYQVVFYPASLGKGKEYVFGGQQVAAQNKGIAKFSNREDGLIDGYAFSKYVQNHVKHINIG